MQIKSGSKTVCPNWIRGAGLASVLSAILALGGGGASASVIFSPRTHSPTATDENGVDLGTGQYVPPTPSASIGDASSGFAESMGGTDFPNGSRYIGGITVIDPMDGQQVWARSSSKPDTNVYVYFGGMRHQFGCGNICGAEDGSIIEIGTLDRHRFEGEATLTTSDGTVAKFNGLLASDFGVDARFATLSSITRPDGEILTFTYNQQQVASNTAEPDAGQQTPPLSPPEWYIHTSGADIGSSLGWCMGVNTGFGFSSATMSNCSVVAGPTTGIGAGGTWDLLQADTLTGVGSNTYVQKGRTRNRLSIGGDDGQVLIKQSVEHRSSYMVIADNTLGGGGIGFLTAADSNELPEYQPTFVNEGLWDFTIIEKYEVTYQDGHTITVDYTKPADDVHKPFGMYGHCLSQSSITTGTCVKTVTRGTSVWKYTWSDFGASVDIEDPLGKHRHVTTAHSRECGTQILTDQDALGHTTQYEYGIFYAPASLWLHTCLLVKVTYPEGNYDTYTYDDRENLTEAKYYPNDNGAPRVISAHYPSSCSLETSSTYNPATDYNFKICNKPLWTKDAKGNQTDYTYSPDHGGVLTVTLPADQNGVHAQTRNVYTQVMPQARNSSGALVNTSPVWRLHCTVTLPSTASSDPATCAAAAQYQVTTYAYGTANLQLTSITTSAGDGTLSSTISYGYDAIGNRVWVDGPRTDVDDKTYATYDPTYRRRLVFEIGVDPDGSGPLRRQAVKHHYNADFQEDRTDMGTCGTVTFANGVPTDCADFTVSTFKRITFDINGRPAKTELVQP